MIETIDKVMLLQRQGLTNSQIINHLFVQGMDYSKIHDAFYEIELRNDIPIPTPINQIPNKEKIENEQDDFESDPDEEEEEELNGINEINNTGQINNNNINNNNINNNNQFNNAINNNPNQPINQNNQKKEGDTMPNYPQGMPPPGMPPPNMPPGAQPMPQQGPGAPQGYPPQPQEMGMDDSGYNDETAGRVEELVEAIIDEKWKEITANISRIIDWKEKTDIKITELETRFNGLKDNFDKLHTSILEKVGDYDKHIQDVGTEVKALEKVFQKILPGFLENINELSRITDNLKKVQK
ncbi:hypothetical protein HOK51_07330 [Candidatus Woesearchaeota archaeon]|jgi:hypothetical protein|nr:hypothetical protein [Candidatus Woesearchaeota archaeon]MBT6519634.1 hypothetical protein [Candidatus Woesearchaeota archaeon]MBT7367549.1 hypothetical protein [Candidatus Woesearchaeota archaeon]